MAFSRHRQVGTCGFSCNSYRVKSDKKFKSLLHATKQFLYPINPSQWNHRHSLNLICASNPPHACNLIVCVYAWEFVTLAVAFSSLRMSYVSPEEVALKSGFWKNWRTHHYAINLTSILQTHEFVHASKKACMQVKKHLEIYLIVLTWLPEHSKQST